MKKDTTQKNTREKSKTRAWEKGRRDRFSESFDKLKLALPNYDASRKLSKIDILLVATSTIRDLDEKLKHLLVPSESEKVDEQRIKVSADIIKKLEDRVRMLLVRNEELTNLLKSAGIRVPAAFGYAKNFTKLKKHSNRINPKQAKMLQLQLEKENQVKPLKPPNPKKGKRNVGAKYKRVSSNSKTSNKSVKKQFTNLMSSSNCLFIVSQPRIINNSCYIVSKSPKQLNSTVISNSLLVKTPIVSSNIKPSVLSTNPAMPNLGPGTLVFANGTVMPVVQTPPRLPVLPTIFTNPVQTTLSTLIVVSCNTKTASTNKMSVSTATKSVTKHSTKNLDSVLPVSKSSPKDSANILITGAVIKPKICVTRTTQINKVPIPALSSKYNSHLCLANSKIQSSTKKINFNGLNESKNPTESNSKNKSEKRKILDKSSQEPKKHKSNAEENKNLDNSALTVNARLSDQLTSNDNIEASGSTLKIGRSVSEEIKGDKEAKKQGSDKGSQEVITSGNSSVFNLEKDTLTSVSELCKTPTALVDSEDPASKSNKKANICDVFNSLVNATSKKLSKPNDASERHAKKEALSIVENGKNNREAIKENFQTMSDQRTKTSCASDMSVELSTSSHSSVPPTTNKQLLKSFEINISESESITRNNNANDLKTLEINLPQSELSNDIFASFQVPAGCQNPGSTSPTAAFLLAFPLVSSGVKVTEVIGDENSESHAGTPNLLQIGTMEISKPTQSYSDSLTPNILNFENFSFFSNKDNNCGGFYNNCSMVSSSCQTNTTNVTSSSKTSFSINKSTTLPPQDINIGNHNIHSKLNAADNLTFLTSNKSEINNITTSNQSNFKTDVTEKVSSHIKNVNVNTHHEPVRLAKNLESQSYISTSYDFNRTNERSSVTTNLLDMNTNSFPSKLVSNENYVNKMKSNMSGQILISKSSNGCTNYPNYRDCTPFITNSSVLNKNYNSVCTSAANTDYFYNPSGSMDDNRHLIPSNCNNYSDYRKTDTYNNYTEGPHGYKDKFNQNMQPKIKSSSTQNKPINWMTSPNPTVSYKAEYFLPSLPKEHNLNSNLSTNTTFKMPSNTYFNTSSVYNPTDNLNSTSDIRKTVDLSLPTYNSYQRTESDENQFSWSPSKMPQFLEPTHPHTFVSSTLPTLVGDLALNNTPISEQKTIKDKNGTNQRKVVNCENQSVPTNFLSVSQLVEHNEEHAPAKVISRRSSGNRSKTNAPKSKRVVNNRPDANKDIPSSYQKNDKVNQHNKHYDISVATNLFSEPKQQPRNNKNVPSSYSAEALIGNQLSTESLPKKNTVSHNKSIMPNFLSDNIVSYFPAIDVTQDNGYGQANQSFQSNSFPQNFPTTFQNNTYGPNNFIPSACTLASTYIPNNNFMHSSNNQEFLGENPHLFSNSNNVQTKDKNIYMKNYYRQPDKNEKNQAYNCKKAKKRTINEGNLPSFDIPFLSMPGTINSPILPDDFHTTYLPPTTLYSCKTPLYAKPNPEMTPSTLIPPLPAISANKSGIQHSEMSLSANSVGTSLTNFNLSTIFPEINKGPIQENFSDLRNKDYHPVTKSFSMSSSLQVPFNSKSSISFGNFGT